MGDQGTQGVASPAVGEVSPATPAPAPAEGSHLVLLRRKWFERQRVVELNDLEAADNLLQSLVDLRLDLGVANLESFTESLMSESRKAMDKNQVERAFKLANVARALSPDYPPAHWHFAKTAFLRNALDFGEYGGAVISAIALHFTSLDLVLQHLGNITLLLIFALTSAALVAMVVMILRHAPVMAHLLQHVFIVKLPPLISHVIIAAVFAVPVVLGWGLGLLLLYWAAILLLVVRAAERTILVVLVAALFVVPYAIPWFAGVVTARSEPEYGYFLAMRNELDAPSLQRLRDYQARHDTSGVGAFALGTLHKKRAQYALAKTYFEEALTKGYAPAATRTNLANVIFAAGDATAAIEEYKKAAAINPGFFYANYNLSQAYYAIKDVQRGTEALAHAKDNNSRLMVFYYDLKPSNALSSTVSFNRLLADAPIPNHEIIALLFKPSPLKDDLRGLYWSQTMRPLSLQSLPLTTLLGVPLFVVLVALGSLLKWPTVCVKCGEAACQWCYATPKRTDLCSQCFSVFVRREAVDPVARDQKEQEISRFEARQRQASRLLTLLSPGSGHVFRGFMIKGFFALILFFVLVVWSWFWQGPLVSSWVPGVWATWGKIAGIGVAVLAIYLWAFRDLAQE